jgi:hypothetical protein
MRFIEKQIQNLLINNLADYNELLPLAKTHLGKLKSTKTHPTFFNSSTIEDSTRSTTFCNSSNLSLVSKSESFDE